VKKVFEKIKLILNQLLYTRNRGLQTKEKFVIIDKFFPLNNYPWRYLEIKAYLETFNKSLVLCEDANYKGKRTKQQFNNELTEFLKTSKGINPKRIQRVSSNPFKTNYQAKLFYFLFYEDAVRFYPYLKQNKINFGFTLYPGGGFIPYNNQVDAQLNQIVGSNLCKFVIVDMPYTKKYLLDWLNLDTNKIKVLYGPPIEHSSPNDKMWFKKSIMSLKICFAAKKYMKRGCDKGFDVFIEIAKHFFSTDFNIQFHCFGDFKINDLSENELKFTNIYFHGLLPPIEYHEQISKMDIIISPNRCYTNGGDIDGFPTASVIEAGLNQVLMMCSDPLNNNQGYFKDGEEIIIISDNINDIIRKIEYLYFNEDKIQEIASKGREKIRTLFSYENTIQKRVEIIRKFI